jgi:hypothetical protein
MNGTTGLKTPVEGKKSETFVEEIEKVDEVLLNTLGNRGSMITGGLSGAGIGLALGDIPGAFVGLAIGVCLGAIGTLGRS